MNDDNFKIPRLNDENYHSWAIRVKAALVHKDCWDAIEPGYGDVITEREKKTNEKAITFLFLVVDDNYLDDISDCKRAKDAWDILERINTKYGLLHTLQLTRDLFNVKFEEYEDMKTYLARIMDLHRKLKGSDYCLRDKELALIMLLGLPKHYEALILHLEQNEENLNSQDVKCSLLLEEKRKNKHKETEDTNEVKVLLIKRENKIKEDEIKTKDVPRFMRRMDSKQVKSKYVYHKNLRCFCCGGLGHISKNCASAKMGEQTRTNKIVCRALGMSTEETNNRNDIWYLDSGASHHMTNCHDNFMYFMPIKSSVEMANGEKLMVLGKGIVEVTTSQNGCKLQLCNTLYVPKLDGNLISMGCMEENGLQVVFSQGKAIIKRVNSNVELVTSTRNGNLYGIQVKTKFCRSTDERLWHRRLGHLHFEAMRKLQNRTNDRQIHSSQKDLETCEICMKGKIKRHSFPKKVAYRSTELLGLIHSDLMGPLKQSKGGSKYVVTFVDDYSRYTKVYFLKRKNEALSKFTEYQREVERQIGNKIKVLRSDNGTEYVNDDFDKYLKEQGIVRQLTVPDNPQQNGVAERINQTLMDMTRCLLIESGVPRDFWADALNTATYIRNKCPSAATKNIPPEELWTNKNSERTHLRVFGCRAWNTVRKQRRSDKLDPKGEENIFMGYSKVVKGYRLWNRTRQRMFLGRDVVFDENVFPYKLDGNSLQEDLYLNLKVNDSTDYSEQVVDSVEVEEPEPNIGLKENSEDNINNIDLKGEKSAPRRSERIAKNQEINTKCKTVSYSKEKKVARDPNNLKEALKSQDVEEWRHAMEEELKSLEENRTWELVKRPRGRNVLGSKWVFKRKYDTSGRLQKYKARLVAKGFSQQYGVDYQETFAPVVKQKTLRLLLAIAVERQWKTYQIDVKSAYLNGHLDEEVYMERPEREELYNDDLVCLLHKSVYGLKQSGRQWNTRLDKFLKEWGLKNSKADPCVYYHTKKEIIIGIYVDDVLILVNDEKTYRDFQTAINREFGARDLGEARDLLGIKIEKDEDGNVTLSQGQYIQEILESFKMEEVKEASTPLVPGTKYRKLDKESMGEDLPYRQAIGSLLYLSGSTRPDLAYATSYMSQFSEKPSKEHWTGIKHICKYLKKTKETKLRYIKTGSKLEIYADADWGSDINDRKSYSGYVIMLAGAAISWSSRKQKCTALSTVEAEYLALCEVSKEVMWMQHILEEVGATEFMHNPNVIKSDSQGAISLIHNRVTSEKSKHIDLRHFFIRDLIDEKRLKFEYVPTKENPADLLTKSLIRELTERHKQKLGLVKYRTKYKDHQEEVSEI